MLWLIGRNALVIISGLETGDARDEVSCDDCCVLLHCSMALRDFHFAIRLSDQTKKKITCFKLSFFVCFIDLPEQIQIAPAKNQF